MKLSQHRNHVKFAVRVCFGQLHRGYRCICENPSNASSSNGNQKFISPSSVFSKTKLLDVVDTCCRENLDLWKNCIVTDESSRLKRTRSVTIFFLESSLTSICKWKVNWHQFEPLWSWRSPSEFRSRRLSKRRRTLECDRTISLTVDARRLKRDEYLWNFLKRRERGPHVRTDLIWNTCARWESACMTRRTPVRVD